MSGNYSRKIHFYYDYAGGTYYVFNLGWFYNCPETKEYEVLVWIRHGSDTFNWHIFHEGIGYTEEGPIKLTKELKDYCQEQRIGQDAYREKFKQPKLL